MPRAGSVAKACTERQHARAHEEGAQQRQRERDDRQQHRPHLEAAALLGHGQRVDQRGAGQPGHEGGVLDRVPEPPAAPAEFVVGPGAAQRDAQRQEDPGDRRPRPRPARPGGVEPAGHQCRDREREGHREPDVAHVEQRRVEDHARVLQQRVQVAAVGGGRQQALEGVRREQREEQEARADQTHDAEHARDHRLGQLAREQRHGDRPAGKDQRPHQDRAFVVAPHRGDAVVQRQRRVRVHRCELDREVVGLPQATRRPWVRLSIRDK